MNPEEKQMLQQSFELAKQNNTMLHGMRRSQRWAAVMRVIYWALILAASYGVYKYAEPYLTRAMDLFKASQAQLDNLKNLGDKFKNF